MSHVKKNIPLQNFLDFVRNLRIFSISVFSKKYVLITAYPIASTKQTKFCLVSRKTEEKSWKSPSFSREMGKIQTRNVWNEKEFSTEEFRSKHSTVITKKRVFQVENTQFEQCDIISNLTKCSFINLYKTQSKKQQDFELLCDEFVFLSYIRFELFSFEICNFFATFAIWTQRNKFLCERKKCIWWSASLCVWCDVIVNLEFQWTSLSKKEMNCFDCTFFNSSLELSTTKKMCLVSVIFFNHSNNEIYSQKHEEIHLQ